jgi:hypothetical protein
MSNKLIQKIQRIGFQWEMENPFLFCAHHREAFEDYRRTGFGGWPWESDDPVNDRNSGRFAQYADGRTETP